MFYNRRILLYAKMKKFFCEKCNKVIKVSETPWCSQCRKKMLTDIFERSQKIKSLTKMANEKEKEIEGEEVEEIEEPPFEEGEDLPEI